MPRYTEPSLSAQTAYAELAERARAFEIDSALAWLSGNFHTLKRKGNTYWYFSYREAGVERSRVVYIGPDNEQVRALVERFRSRRAPKALAPQAQADGGQELRVDFLTSKGRSGKPVKVPELNIALEPLKFMEFSLEGTTQSRVRPRC